MIVLYNFNKNIQQFQIQDTHVRHPTKPFERSVFLLPEEFFLRQTFTFLSAVPPLVGQDAGYTLAYRPLLCIISIFWNLRRVVW